MAITYHYCIRRPVVGRRTCGGWFWISLLVAALLVILGALPPCSSAATNEEVLLLSSNDATTTRKAKRPQLLASHDRETDLEFAAEWMNSMGIYGLCHPTLDIYGPAFPKCSDATTNNTSRKSGSSALMTVSQQQQHILEKENLNPQQQQPQQRDTDDIHQVNVDSFRRDRTLEEEDYYQEQFNDYYSYVEDVVVDDDVIEIDEDAIDHGKTKWFYIINASCAFLCVIGGAVASGLTVGLLSLDPLLLVIKMRAGTTALERKQAADLLPIVKQHHRVLVTLLLLNTIAGESLPVFLQGMVPNSVAILGSVVLVLVFCEILPTALFTGPSQLQIASRLAPLVKILLVLLSPITFPIAKLLDKIMHDDDEDGADEFNNGDPDGGPGHGFGGTLYNRGELAALIRVQHEERLVAKQRRKHQRKTSLAAAIPDLHHVTSGIQAASEVRALKQEMIQHQVHQLQQQQQQQQQGHHQHQNHQGHHNRSPSAIRFLEQVHHHNRSPSAQRFLVPESDSIDADEITIMEGALQLKTKTAMDILLSFHKVFCISYDMPLDDSNIFKIYASGYSRVPVFINNDRRLIKGILLTRQLMVVKPTRSNGDDTSPTTDEQTNDAEQKQTVSDLKLHLPQCVAPNTNLVKLVNLFQTGGSAVRAGHMALVCARPDIAHAALDQGQAVPEEAGLMGIITLEDVLEALLQEQIYDEMDAEGRMHGTNHEVHAQQEDEVKVEPILLPVNEEPGSSYQLV